VAGALARELPEAKPRNRVRGAFCPRLNDPSQSSGLYGEESAVLLRGTYLVKLTASEIARNRWYFGVGSESKFLW